MHGVSVIKTLVFGLLASAPLAAAFTAEAGANEVEGRHVGSLSAMASRVVRAVIPDIERRHHTEAQIEAKEAAAAARKGHRARSPQAADEFGPWDSTEDEFGSWVDKREPHHTESQIKAKEAAAAAKEKNNRARSAQAADEFGPWDSTEDEFGSWVDKRQPHHTEAQIKAKEAAAAARGNQKRHHTESQIAAKEAAAAAARENDHRSRSPQAADEFGPWDSTEDEFGSWVDKREPHHTEAQIKAKEAAAEAKHNQKRHHTESQIKAKEAAAAAKQNQRRHHTESQIKAKEAAAAEKANN